MSKDKKYLISGITATFWAAGLSALLLFVVTADPVGAQTDLDKDLIGCWTFDDKDSPGKDTSGSDHHGTLHGSVWKQDISGNGVMKFDGKDDYIDLGDVDEYEFSADAGFSISLWVKPEEKQGVRSRYAPRGDIIGRNKKGSGRTWLITHMLSPYLDVGDGKRIVSHYIGRGLRYGAWYHLAVAVGPEGKAVVSYLNGEKTGEKKRAMGQLAQGPSAFRIGGERNYFKGEIDDVRIYKRVLTREEIAALNALSKKPPKAYSQKLDVLINKSPSIKLVAHSPGKNDALTYTILKQPENGTLRGEAPDLTYIPNRGFTGVDTFDFKANNGTYDSNTATVSIHVNLRSFPGAEGFGAIATGGRGGRVIKVTTLKPDGPGSLQWACSQKGPRIVVFDVAGVIVPPNRSKGKTWLAVKRDDITIAGQTAPSPGVVINGMISLDRPHFGDKQTPRKERGTPVHNVIIRFMRARPYLKSGGRGSNLRGVELGAGRNVIMDHVSLCWSSDDCLAGASNPMTVQWCVVEESDIHLEGGDEPHNFAMLTGYRGLCPITFHHNILAHHMHRAPMFGIYPADFRNNVHYNIGTGIRILMYSKYHDKAKINIIGEYCSRGPGALLGYTRAYAPPCVSAFSIGLQNDAGTSKFHIDGNFLDPLAGYSETWSNSVKARKTYVEKPFVLPPVETHTAEEGYELALAQAGCLPRDAVGKRTIREIQTHTGLAGMNVPDGGLMEGLTPGTAPPDTDNDGMSDEWEKEHGCDPNDPKDNTKIVPAGVCPGDRYKGYSYIEYYMNELADIRVARALTEYRLNTEEPKPWDKPAKGLSACAAPHKTVDEMVKAVVEQDESKGHGTSSAWYAIQQLSRLGEKAKPAVSKLIEVLDTAKGNRKASFTAWAIGAIGPSAAEAVPTLVKALQRDWPVYNSKWKYDPRGFIAWAAGRIGPEAKEAVPHLAKLLNGKDRRAKVPAAWALSRMGTAAEPAMSELLSCMHKDVGLGMRFQAAQALAGIGKPAVPGLRKKLTARGKSAVAAALSLGLMGPDAKEALPELAQLLKVGNPSVRREAAKAIGRIGPGSESAVDAMISALEDETYGVRHMVAKALEAWGPDGAKAVPGLEQRFKDERKEVKRAAVLCLGSMGVTALPILSRACTGDDTFVRKYAARALSRLGKDSVPILIKALSDKDAQVRREAVWSLGRLGKQAAPVVDALKKMLSDNDYVVRYAAGEVLKQLRK